MASIPGILTSTVGDVGRTVAGQAQESAKKRVQTQMDRVKQLSVQDLLSPPSFDELKTKAGQTLKEELNGLKDEALNTLKSELKAKISEELTQFIEKKLGTGVFTRTIRDAVQQGRPPTPKEFAQQMADFFLPKILGGTTESVLDAILLFGSAKSEFQRGHGYSQIPNLLFGAFTGNIIKSVVVQNVLPPLGRFWAWSLGRPLVRMVAAVPADTLPGLIARKTYSLFQGRFSDFPAFEEFTAANTGEAADLLAGSFEGTVLPQTEAEAASSATAILDSVFTDADLLLEEEDIFTTLTSTDPFEETLAGGQIDEAVLEEVTPEPGLTAAAEVEEDLEVLAPGFEEAEAIAPTLESEAIGAPLEAFGTTYESELAGLSGETTAALTADIEVEGLLESLASYAGIELGEGGAAGALASLGEWALSTVGGAAAEFVSFSLPAVGAAIFLADFLPKFFAEDPTVRVTTAGAVIGSFLLPPPFGAIVGGVIANRIDASNRADPNFDVRTLSKEKQKSDIAYVQAQLAKGKDHIGTDPRYDQRFMNGIAAMQLRMYESMNTVSEKYAREVMGLGDGYTIQTGDYRHATYFRHGREDYNYGTTDPRLQGHRMQQVQEDPAFQAAYEKARRELEEEGQGSFGKGLANIFSFGGQSRYYWDQEKKLNEMAGKWYFDHRSQYIAQDMHAIATVRQEHAEAKARREAPRPPQQIPGLINVRTGKPIVPPPTMPRIAFGDRVPEVSPPTPETTPDPPAPKRPRRDLRPPEFVAPPAPKVPHVPPGQEPGPIAKDAAQPIPLPPKKRKIVPVEATTEDAPSTMNTAHSQAVPFHERGGHHDFVSKAMSHHDAFDEETWRHAFGVSCQAFDNEVGYSMYRSHGPRDLGTNHRIPVPQVRAILRVVEKTVGAHPYVYVGVYVHDDSLLSHLLDDPATDTGASQYAFQRGGGASVHWELHRVASACVATLRDRYLRTASLPRHKTRIVFTGFGVSGAVSLLMLHSKTVAEWAFNRVGVKNVEGLTFASPRFCSAGFVHNSHDSERYVVSRMVVRSDPLPSLPQRAQGYAHVGMQRTVRRNGLHVVDHDDHGGWHERGDDYDLSKDMHAPTLFMQHYPKLYEEALLNMIEVGHAFHGTTSRALTAKRRRL